MIKLFKKSLSKQLYKKNNLYSEEIISEGILASFYFYEDKKYYLFGHKFNYRGVPYGNYTKIERFYQPEKKLKGLWVEKTPNEMKSEIKYHIKLSKDNIRETLKVLKEKI